jgi:hypothetical protein
VNKKDYDVAFNKNEDTIVVTYKRGVVAKSKNRWLGWFVTCVVMGIIMAYFAAIAVSVDIWAVVLFAICAIEFFLTGRVFIKQFEALRMWLTEFGGSKSEKKG